MSDPFDGDRLLADTSAWSSIGKAPDALKQAWATALREGRIVCCAIVEYELTIAVRNHNGIEQLGESLGRLVHLKVQTSTVNVALSAIRELATVGGDGYHRVPLADALIAATASDDRHMPVVHYDHHFDRLAEVLPFESRPIAPFGSI